MVMYVNFQLCLDEDDVNDIVFWDEVVCCCLRSKKTL